MALLISDLEKAEIVSVLQVGSGGDYLIEIPGKSQLQAECSGIKVDAHGYDSRARLAQKRIQVLTNCVAGYASVTTFNHCSTEVVGSRLSPRLRRRTKAPRMSNPTERPGEVHKSAAKFPRHSGSFQLNAWRTRLESQSCDRRFFTLSRNLLDPFFTLFRSSVR